MKFRTQLAAVAAVALLAGLVACGGDDKDEASSGPSTTQTDTSTTTDASHPAGHAGMAMITMKDNSFTPASVEVAPGTQVMVMNEGAAIHNLKDSDSKGKAFDSGDVDAGKEGSITAPAKAGSYKYECTYHFGMTGTLKVK
jgi:plastocyanin